jgi:hypothetical protein
MKQLTGLLKSKTFWLNVIAGTTAVVNALAGPWIPNEVAIAAVAVLNIINRFLTTKPLSGK